MAFCVPIIALSVVDFMVELEKGTTYEELSAEIEQSAERGKKECLGYCDEPLLYTDFEARHVSSTFDGSAGIMLDPTFVKLMALYDAEWGYSCRMVDWLHVHGVRVTVLAMTASQPLVEAEGSVADVGKLTAMAFRVPTIDVSDADLTVEQGFTRRLLGELAEEHREVAGFMIQLFGHVGASAGILMLAECDNEWGYSCRVMDLIKHMTAGGKLFKGSNSRRGTRAARRLDQAHGKDRGLS